MLKKEWMEEMKANMNDNDKQVRFTDRIGYSASCYVKKTCYCLTYNIVTYLKSKLCKMNGS